MAIIYIGADEMKWLERTVDGIMPEKVLAHRKCATFATMLRGVKICGQCGDKITGPYQDCRGAVEMKPEDVQAYWDWLTEGKLK